MPERNVLLVLVIHDAGLRSTLAARLSMAGIDVMTVEDLRDPRLDKGLRRAGTMVVDRGIIESQPDNWHEAMADTARWRQIIALVDEAARATEADGRVQFVPRRKAAAGILALLEALPG